MKSTKQVAPKARQTRRRKPSRSVVRKQPTSNQYTVNTKAVVVRSNSNLTVSHREMVYGPIKVAHANSFWVKRFILNAGNPTTFKWLSSVAINFDRYKFLKVKFVYVPSCSTLTDGTISMSFDPNAADSDPTSTVEILGMQTACQGNTYGKLEMEIPKRVLDERGILYMKSEDSIQNTDPRIYDLGNLYLSPYCGTTSNLGSLFIEYEVQLLNMQIPKFLSKVWQSKRNFWISYVVGANTIKDEVEEWSKDPLLIYPNEGDTKIINFGFPKRGNWYITICLLSRNISGGYVKPTVSISNMDDSSHQISYDHYDDGSGNHSSTICYLASNLNQDPEIGTSLYLTAGSNDWWNNQEFIVLVSGCGPLY